MKNLKQFAKEAKIVVYEDNGRVWGNACNIVAYPKFWLWVNKSGSLTVKTRGTQKTFKHWKTKNEFVEILKGFEIL